MQGIRLWSGMTLKIEEEKVDQRQKREVDRAVCREHEC